jgi:hypothetical protein
MRLAESLPPPVASLLIERRADGNGSPSFESLTDTDHIERLEFERQGGALYAWRIAHGEDSKIGSE